MPWKETDVMQERIRFVALALKPSQSFSDLCDVFGISRTTGYRWLNRYYEHRSFTALTDRSRAPHHHPNQTAAAIEARIVALRREYGWGAKKLRILLAREGTMTVSLSTINRILKRQGLLRRKDAHRPAPTRFERKEPNQLWQVDFKGRFRVAGGHCYPLSILDDHSRFALGLYPLRSTGGRQTYACLVNTLKKYGVPQAMLMDHGTPWWNTNSYSGLSWVAVQLIKQGIRLYFSAYRHPQTQGKVEAFHRTISRAFDHHGLPETFDAAFDFFGQFVFDYNHVRPHEGIDMQMPANRYQPSAKPYDPTPPPWEYPQNSQVTRINSQGSLTYRGKRYFVAKPLANERVTFKELDGKLLVLYRHMYVREIDLLNGSSRSFVRPTRDAIYV